jgi:hypothetical protein
VVARALVGWLCVPSTQVIGVFWEATADFNFPPRVDGVIACVHTLPHVRPEHALHSMSVGGFTLALANSNFVAVHGRGRATPRHVWP